MSTLFLKRVYIYIQIKIINVSKTMTTITNNKIK